MTVRVPLHTHCIVTLKTNMSLRESLQQPNAVKLQCAAEDWKEAVRIGIQLLLDRGIAEPRYYDAIITSVEQNGPYFLLMPYVALPHARPENGALKEGFSLVTLRTPVNFGSTENDPIGILLSFAAANATAQLENTLAQAALLFEEEERVTSIANAHTMQEIQAVLDTVDFREVE
jgi:PTS system ascorbate-specific IIA component